MTVIKSPGTPAPKKDPGVKTVANGVTAFRLVAFFPLFIELTRSVHNPWHAFWWGLAFSVNTALDIADGYIARHFDQGSRFGKLFDHIVDKIQTFPSLGWIVLRFHVGLPWRVACIIIVAVRLLQDITSETLYIRKWRQGREDVGANFPSKVKMWADMIGFMAAYTVFVHAHTKSANYSAGLVCLGSGIAVIAATISLRRKFASL